LVFGLAKNIVSLRQSSSAGRGVSLFEVRSLHCNSERILRKFCLTAVVRGLRGFSIVSELRYTAQINKNLDFSHGNQ